jgi:hypothetical protein
MVGGNVRSAKSSAVGWAGTGKWEAKAWRHGGEPETTPVAGGCCLTRVAEWWRRRADENGRKLRNGGWFLRKLEGATEIGWQVVLPRHATLSLRRSQGGELRALLFFLESCRSLCQQARCVHVEAPVHRTWTFCRRTKVSGARCHTTLHTCIMCKPLVQLCGFTQAFIYNTHEEVSSGFIT